MNRKNMYKYHEICTCPVAQDRLKMRTYVIRTRGNATETDNRWRKKLQT